MARVRAHSSEQQLIPPKALPWLAIVLAVCCHDVRAQEPTHPASMTAAAALRTIATLVNVDIRFDARANGAARVNFENPNIDDTNFVAAMFGHSNIARASAYAAAANATLNHARRADRRPSGDVLLPDGAILTAGTLETAASLQTAGSLPATGALPETPLWERHRPLILILIATIVIEFALIAALLLVFLRRGRAETALQESEARWRSVFETSAAGVAVMDPAVRFVAANAAFQSMLGYTDRELRDLTWSDVSFTEDRDTAQLVDDLKHGTQLRYDIVKQLRRKDGSTIWSHLFFSRIVDADAKPRLFIATALDITDRKAAEDAMRTARTELAQIARLTTMGEMTASIAHEINQPLAAIVANGNAGLRWLANATPDIDEVRATLKRIVRDGHRAGKVITGVRTIFKKQIQARAAVDVNDLIQEVLALVRGELEARKTAIRVELGQIPPVTADRLQFQQVILNLVMNALDAMAAVNDRPRVLRLRSERCEPGGIMVTVQNSGPGIERKNIHHIFEPFFTTKSNGTGMGLSICRSVVEAHGGRLMASHGHPHGAVFQIILPIQEPGAERPAASAGARPVEMVRR